MRRTRQIVLAVVALAAGLALSPLPAEAHPAPARATATTADPGAPGTLSWRRVDFDGGFVVLTDPEGASYPSELTGSVTIPAGDGPFPVIVLLHGRHSACKVVTFETLGYPCPDAEPVSSPIPSHTGYDYLSANLASHGYLVASTNANAVNTYDSAGDNGAHERAQLIGDTLDLLVARNAAAGTDGVGALLVGKVDSSRIGMMGHSRGGEGVDTFIDYNRTRPAADGPRYPGLKAVFSLAPTDFGAPVTDGPAFAMLLPLCDGDVSDLQGSKAYDRSRFTLGGTSPRVQFTIRGANHNFFNTIWTDDDDGGSDDTGCALDAPVPPTSVRLVPADQRSVGVVLMAGFFRRYVGDETQFDALMTGDAKLPASICPVGPTPKPSCDGLVGVSYHHPLTNKVLLRPEAGTAATTTSADGLPITKTGLVTVTACDGFTTAAAAACPTIPNRSGARQLTLAWTGVGALRIPLRAHSTALPSDRVSVRLAVNHSQAANPAGTEQKLDLAVIDGAGHTAVVPLDGRDPSALTPSVGSSEREVTLNAVRVPLAEAAAQGVDLHDLAALELRTGRAPTGNVQVAELDLASAPIANVDPAPTVPDLPRPALALLAALLLASAALLLRRRPA